MSISASSGLTSNIDYQSMISQLVAIKREPVNALYYQQKTLKTASSAYSTLGSLINELKSAADALREADDFKVFKVSSTDTSIISATADSTASAGIYQIKVNSLAQAHKIAADGVSSDTALIASGGGGEFKFQIGTGAVQSVTVDGTTTLKDLRDAINDLKAGVTATIVNDGSSPNPYRLILTGDSTGAANNITVYAPNTADNMTVLNFGTTLQGAANASFTVDNNLTISKASNTNITDVISGVTLNLNSADATKTNTVTVSRDTASIQSKIQKLLDKYNSVVTFIKSNNRYDKETKTSGPFFGDAVARSIWDDLRRAMTSTVSGLPDTMNMLQHIGVESDTDGKMSLDTSKFSTAISENFNDIVNLFIQGETTTGFGKLLYDKADNIGNYSDGRIANRQNGISKTIKNVETSIRNQEAAVAVYESQLRGKFTALETLLTSLKGQTSYLASIMGE